ncbi:hypothetical protein ACH427_18300 [Streptomyces sp. NPDC020379]|uniref:hypothetical protein n=1 Tax=Streptomyces sp. NPDC020379 TaxID=3365071 RepID=UPI0037A6EFD0
MCLDSDTGLFNGVDFGAAAVRYVNLGIAEQNLMGVAAGLARSGRLPYVNTMATFAELGVPAPVRRVAVGDHFAHGTGAQSHLVVRSGITAAAIVTRAREALGATGRR